jgi:hypothetical protein
VEALSLRCSAGACWAEHRGALEEARKALAPDVKPAHLAGVTDVRTPADAAVGHGYAGLAW